MDVTRAFCNIVMTKTKLLLRQGLILVNIHVWSFYNDAFELLGLWDFRYFASNTFPSVTSFETTWLENYSNISIPSRGLCSAFWELCERLQVLGVCDVRAARALGGFRRLKSLLLLKYSCCWIDFSAIVRKRKLDRVLWARLDDLHM